MSSNFFNETLYEFYSQGFKVDEVLFENKTGHQHLIIFKNSFFGNIMALDGVIQTTERDEFIYHEMLTHVPLFSHGSAKKVLIIGGGDGGILREVLKHDEVESVTQVEIDRAVIDMCIKYFPKHSQGAYDDPKANIIIDDGFNFVKNCTEKFDVIISDSTDPIGPGEVLFTEDFYSYCKKCLNDNGIIATQNGVAFMQIDEVKTTFKRMSNFFKDTTFYCAAVPTYVGGAMTFAWSSDNKNLKNQGKEIIEKRFKESKLDTNYYNPDIHIGAFALPQYIQKAIV